MVNYIEILKWMIDRKVNFCTIKNCQLSPDNPNVFIRHDVDDKPDATTWMLNHENKLGVKSMVYIMPHLIPSELLFYEQNGWEIGPHISAEMKGRFSNPKTYDIDKTWILNGIIFYLNALKQFDIRSYTFHGQVDSFRDTLIPIISDNYPKLVEEVDFVTKRMFSILHISDSMSPNKLGMNRKFFFHWKIPVPTWFPQDLLAPIRTEDPLYDYNHLKLCIDNMLNGGVYSLLIHPQHWNREGEYALVV